MKVALMSFELFLENQISKSIIIDIVNIYIGGQYNQSAYGLENLQLKLKVKNL